MKVLYPLFLAVALLTTGCAELDPELVGAVLGAPTDQRPLDEATVSRGLKEALRIGSERAIDDVSRVDGFLANHLIRIQLPEELREMAKVLRQIGLHRQVDALETAMNRAAEEASGEARGVFVDAITGMTIADAFGILRGHETAATDYLRTHTSDSLRQRFEPIIERKMERVALYTTYNDLVDAYNQFSFSRQPAVRLDEYLTDRTLDGLFETLAEEEQKIRRDPVARTTELLRRVFGRR